MVRFQPPAAVMQIDDFDDQTDELDAHSNIVQSVKSSRFVAPSFDQSDSDDESLNQSQSNGSPVLKRRILDSEDESDSQLEDEDSINQSMVLHQSEIDQEEKYNDDIDEIEQSTHVTQGIVFSKTQRYQSINHTINQCESDPNILLSSVLSSIPLPPPSATQQRSAVQSIKQTIKQSVGQRQIDLRRSFRSGCSIGDSVCIIQGSKIILTRASGLPPSVNQSQYLSERQIRDLMNTKMLEVHHKFHKSRIDQSDKQDKSSLFIFCDMYIASLQSLHDEQFRSRSISQSNNPIRHAISVFQLIKILWAPEFGSQSINQLLADNQSSTVSNPETQSFFNQSINQTSNLYDERYARLHHVREWFKEQISYQINQSSQSTNQSMKEVWSLLTAYRIEEAIDKCLANQHFRLATLLPQLSSLNEDITQSISDQIDIWKQSGYFDLVEPTEQLIFRLLAGELQSFNQLNGQSIEGDLDWMQALSMHLCYQSEGQSIDQSSSQSAIYSQASIEQGLRNYQAAINHSRAKPPVPAYMLNQSNQSTNQSVSQSLVPFRPTEKRRIHMDDDEPMSYRKSISQSNKQSSNQKYDMVYQLLRLSCDTEQSINQSISPSIFDPASYTNDARDCSLAFHVHATLLHAINQPINQSIKPSLSLLNSYVSQLESISQWEWAVYCAGSYKLMPSVNQPMNQSIKPSICSLVDQYAVRIIERNCVPSSALIERLSVSQSLHQSISIQSVTQTIPSHREYAAKETWLLNHSLNQSVNHTWFDYAKCVQSINQSDFDSMFEFIRRAGEQVNDQPIQSLINQSISLSHDLYIEHRASAEIVRSLITPSNNQSINQSVNQSVYQKLAFFFSHHHQIATWSEQGQILYDYQTIKQSISQSMNQITDQSINHESLQSLKDRIENRINQSMYQSIASINQPIDQSISSTDLIVARLANKLMLESVDRWLIEFDARDRAMDD